MGRATGDGLDDAPLAHLTLRWATRPGWATPGAGAAERRYREFVVDGRPLRARLGNPERVTMFGWLPSWVEDEAARRLLLEAPTPLEGQRQELYVCPECADLGCGALTAVVARDGPRVVWRDFGDQRSPELRAVQRGRYRAVGPFAFAAATYERTIRNLREQRREEGGGR